MELCCKFTRFCLFYFSLEFYNRKLFSIARFLVRDVARNFSRGNFQIFWMKNIIYKIYIFIFFLKPLAKFEIFLEGGGGNCPKIPLGYAFVLGTTFVRILHNAQGEGLRRVTLHFKFSKEICDRGGVENVVLCVT